jgi:hypothetical protein
MSTRSKLAAFGASVCLLGLAAWAYVPVFGEPSAEKGPLATAMDSAPLSYTFQIQGGETGIILAPTPPIGKPLNPFAEPGTFQPIPTHWDRIPFALIPGHWDAKTILLAPPSMSERSRITSIAIK